VPLYTVDSAVNVPQFGNVGLPDEVPFSIVRSTWFASELTDDVEYSLAEAGSVPP